MSEFLQHDDARKNRILEAALQEFASKGYKKASTNTIVREAQVSKGLLFHYFISKKELYIYIFNYAVEVITQELYDGVNFSDHDVLNRLNEATIQKINSYMKHELFSKIFEKHPDVLDEDIIARTTTSLINFTKDSYAKIFDGIDYYLFDEKINVEKSLDVIRWTIDRISQDWVERNNNVYDPEAFSELKQDIKKYLDLFRNSFYK